MLRELDIVGFRAFEKFRLPDIGRVNLLVGLNNSGKTSILEALQLLASPGDRTALHSILLRRGEQIVSQEPDPRARLVEVDIRRIFHGHLSASGACFEIRCSRSTHERDMRLKGTIEDLPRDNERDERQETLFDGPFDETETNPALVLRWSNGLDSTRHFRMTPEGGVTSRILGRMPIPLAHPESNVRFVSSASLSAYEVVDLFDEIVLTDEEALVIEVLQTIEPSIERLASIQSQVNVFRRYDGRPGGMLVKCKGEKGRVPIGTMGDGIWRLLGLSLALVKAEGGILLVDEIDSGLHFTVMEAMWRLIWSTAERLDIQVFASTHNSDCWTGLSALIESGSVPEDAARIHRIEKGRREAVTFSQKEIVHAARRAVEVR